MTFSFNLIDEPWIPCRMSDSGGHVELGLAETLARAHEVQEIGDPTPLVTVALHRMLLAVLHRLFGPADLGAWQRLWEAGQWPRADLDVYWRRWRARFDLFASDRPFYQAAHLDSEEAVPISKLLPELASGNNPTLFDHTTDDNPPALSAALTARCLMSAQSFSPGGLVSRVSEADKSARAAPLVKGAVVLARGRTLFETLMLNLHPYNRALGLPFEAKPDDAPAWERTEGPQAEERWPTGYLDLLTWQSRQIRLLPEIDSGGRVVVHQVVIMKGNQFPSEFTLHGRETMLAFWKLERGVEAWLPLGFQEDRALWRDSLALLQSLDDRRARPRMLDRLDELAELGVLDRSASIPIDLFGLCADRAKVLFWRHERTVVPLAYLKSDGEEILSRLGRALRLSEEAGQLLVTTARRVGEHILSGGPGRADPRRLADLAERLAPGRPYWSRLELPFRRLLLTLPTSEEALAEWATEVRRAARGAFDAAMSGLEVGPRTLRAVAQGGRLFIRDLENLTSPFFTQEAPNAPGR
jgi:CRISPR system Cascade subunit CasA